MRGAGREGIAIVGMACRYPDARNPGELWENVLARRRAFRRLPPERLRLEDYLTTDADGPADPDSLYATEAAVLEGWEFDRVRFRVAGPTFRSADLAHWLALDVAAQALADAGFPDGAGLPRDATGVLLGNTLTGEFSRANLLRLRWPFVRRTLGAQLAAEGGRRGGSRASSPAWSPPTRRPSRSRWRRRSPAASRTPSPAASATTSTSTAAATRSTAPAPRRCWRWPTPARGSPPAISTRRSPAASTSRSTPSSWSASPAPARSPAARCGCSTPARTASSPARGAASWC